MKDKTEKPILFSTEMIEEIRAGRKTQTRRIIKPQPLPELHERPGHVGEGAFLWLKDLGFIAGEPASISSRIKCPYWAKRLWVKEAHAIVPATAYAGSTDDGVNQLPHRVSPDGNSWAVYRQGWTRCKPGKWRPSIHMPRWACRLLLDVKSVRAERLHDIDCANIRAEGIDCPVHDFPGGCCTSECPDLREAFYAAWDKIHSCHPESAAAKNPWVWVITFEVSDAS